MILSKTAKLFLLGLTLTLSMMNSIAANVISPPTPTTGSRIAGGVRRGMRLLQNDLDSADDDPSLSSNELSMDTDETSSSSLDHNSIDNDDDDEDERQFQHSGFVAPRARQCNTQQSEDQVEFECQSITANSMSDIQDELKFKVRAVDGDYIKITVQYETEVQTAQSETETETQYTIVYDRLIEYRKVGTAQDDHYEWGVDEVVAEWPLNTWDPLSTVQTTPDNRTIFSATNGMVTFTFTIAQSDSDNLSTNKMKIDFLLEKYPWDASGNTYIALVSRIETEREIETETETGQDEVSDVLINFKDAVDTIGFVPFGEYTWATTAEATTSGIVMDDLLNSTNVLIGRSATGTSNQNQNTTIAVIASKSSSTVATSADSTLEEIAFSFVGAGQGADRIYWDPEAGVGYTSSASKKLVGSILLMLSSISIGLILWL